MLQNGACKRINCPTDYNDRDKYMAANSWSWHGMNFSCTWGIKPPFLDGIASNYWGKSQYQKKCYHA